VITKKSKIYIAGHKGMVGSAILKKLKNLGYTELIFRDSSKIDLRNQDKTYKFLKKNKPDVVLIAAAKVGGILENMNYGADFISDNLLIQNNLIIGSFKNRVKKLIFLSSSCAYPKDAPRPLKEKYFFQGKLEETNEPYAIAKLAGMKLCQSLNYQYKTDFITIVPCNLYGENDNFDLKSSHFFPALLKKIHNFKIGKKKYVEIWGNGLAKRELMHVDDLADAAIYFMLKKTDKDIINIGTGKQFTIMHYAKEICKVLNVNPKFKLDLKKPNGMKTKVLDISLAKNLGWKSKISLKSGVERTYHYFINNLG
jgi:GDP-L-fucose synthase